MLREQVASEHKKNVKDPLPPGPGNPTARFLRALWTALLDPHSIFVYLPLAAAVILLYCGASWQMFHIHTDAGHYQCYALAFWQGSQGIHLLSQAQCSYLYQFGVSQSNVPAFHVVPFEYPPLTLLVFSLSLLAPLVYYQIAFAFSMALAVILIYWLLLRYGPRGSGLACAFYLVLGAWATAEGRFDLVPAGLTLLSLIAAEKKRWTLAYIALSLGVLFKIYPLLLFPGLFIAEQFTAGRMRKPSTALTLKTLPAEIWLTLRGARHWHWKNTLLFGGLIIVITGLFALLNFQGALVSQLSYFANRPVQIESTGSTIIWLAALVGHRATVLYSFGSFNVISDLGGTVALIFEGLFVLGYALTLCWQWRGKLDLAQAFLVLLLVFVVTGKVFSPQYLIWLIPLLAYNGAFNRLWLLLWSTISLLTTIIYPYYYSYIPDIRQLPSTPGFIEIVTVRNLVLLLLTLAVLFDWWKVRHWKNTTQMVAL